MNYAFSYPNYQLSRQNQQQEQHPNSFPLAIGPYIIKSRTKDLLINYYQIQYDIAPNITKDDKKISPKSASNEQQQNPSITDNDVSYFYILSNQNKYKIEDVFNKFIDFSGLDIPMETHDHRIISSMLIIMKMPKDLRTCQSILYQMTEGDDLLSRRFFPATFTDTLNLTNLSQFLHGVNIGTEGVLDFILFLCARYSYLNHKKVVIINCSQNNLRSISSFKTAKKIFPDLQTIILEGNPINESYADTFNAIESMGVAIQLLTGGFNKQKGHHTPVILEVEEMTPPQLSTNHYEPEPIEIDENLFVNPVLKAFLETYESSVDDIVRFYNANVMMSVTSEVGREIAAYQYFARSFIHSRDQFAAGDSNAVALNKELFGSQVSFQILSMKCSQLSETMFLYVLHGRFIDRRNIKIGFDRSLIIFLEDNTATITNDQIHFRTV